MSELLQDIDYATHHLVEGFFIGEEREADEALGRVETMLEEAPDRSEFSQQKTRLGQLRSLLDDWNAYRDAPEGEFREWCARRGSSHPWTISFYHGGSDG